MRVDRYHPAIQKRYKDGDIVTIVPRSFVLEQTPDHDYGFRFPCHHMESLYFNRRMLCFCGMHHKIVNAVCELYDVAPVGKSLKNDYSWCAAMFMESYTEEEQREMLAKEEAYQRDEDKRLEQEPL